MKLKNLKNIKELNRDELLYYKGYIDALIINNVELNNEDIEIKEEFMKEYSLKMSKEIDDAHEKMFT